MKKTSYAINTLRRKAYDINLQVVKGFQHCRGAVIYDENGNRQSGYMVKDVATGYFVEGYDECYDFLMDLDDVNEFLKEMYEAQGFDW